MMGFFDKKLINNKKGFSLAEIILVIVLIGVVVAITVPTLVKKTNSAQLKALWREDYGAFYNATQMIMVNNSAGADSGTMKSICADAGHDCIMTAYGKYLRMLKVCTAAANLGTCWHADNNWKYFDNTNGTIATPGSGAILMNGSIIYLYWYKGDCSYTVASFNPPPGICGIMYVDVNGLAKPNVVGMDIYMMWVMSDGLRPYGTVGDNFTGICTRGTTTGQGCSAEYMKIK